MTHAERMAQRALGLTTTISIWSVFISTPESPGSVELFPSHRDAVEWLYQFAVNRWPDNVSVVKSVVDGSSESSIDDLFTMSGNSYYDVSHHDYEVAISEVLK